MLLKAIIILLFIGVIVSLSSALIFLLKDVGHPQKRLLYALGIRIVLTTALIGVIIWGFYSGQLGSQAPWDKKLYPELVLPATLKE